MTWKEILKIFFIALIAGNIMGIVLIQIFETLTITSLIILEISLIITIVLLFIASKLWNKRLAKKQTAKEKIIKNNTKKYSETLDPASEFCFILLFELVFLPI